MLVLCADGQQTGNSRMPWDQQQQQQQQQVPGPQDWNGQQSSGSNPDIYSQAANAPPPTSLPGARGGGNSNNNNNRGDGPGNAPVSLGPQGGRASSQHLDGAPPGQLRGTQIPPAANDMSLEEYADAMAAAAAAKMYSGRAQEAAEAAARHAASPQRSSRVRSFLVCTADSWPITICFWKMHSHVQRQYARPDDAPQHEHCWGHEQLK
ncbi:hypothetical protein MMC07_005686 [Pseudocyphellaria aurata]|nr:hypothetical protein [Pseudocyphellaria aurata]